MGCVIIYQYRVRVINPRDSSEEERESTSMARNEPEKRGYPKTIHHLLDGARGTARRVCSPTRLGGGG